MRVEPSQKIDIKALEVWKWSYAIFSGVLLVVGIVLAVLTFKFDWYAWIVIVYLLLWAIWSAVSIFYLPKLEWRRWCYEVKEEEIELQRGLFFVKRTIIPMVRVQHVDTNQGPIMRKYGLHTITVHTASGTHEIPALLTADADHLRDFIARMARVTDEDI